MSTQRQIQGFERLLQVQASPLPVRIPLRRWLPAVAVGVVIGVLASNATTWLVSPLTPEPPATEARCRFKVPRLEDLPDLEPRMTAGEWRRLESWVKHNPGSYPRAQATQQPTSTESGPCVS